MNKITIKGKKYTVLSEQLCQCHPTGIKKTIKIKEGKKNRQRTFIDYPPVRYFTVVKVG